MMKSLTLLPPFFLAFAQPSSAMLENHSHSAIPSKPHFKESDLGYYAEKYGVLSAFEQMKEGRVPALDPVEDSRMRDAIYDWREWKKKHSPASFASSDI